MCIQCLDATPAFYRHFKSYHTTHILLDYDRLCAITLTFQADITSALLVHQGYTHPITELQVMLLNVFRVSSQEIY